MQTHEHDLETIAAFIDGERVDPQALKRALAHEPGRDYLVELVAMRELVGATAPMNVVPKAPGPTRAWWIVSAAAVFIALVGGLAIGSTKPATVDSVATSAVPAATGLFVPFLFSELARASMSRRAVRFAPLAASVAAFAT